jgi:hypothetical protein
VITNKDIETIPKTHAFIVVKYAGFMIWLNKPLRYDELGAMMMINRTISKTNVRISSLILFPLKLLPPHRCLIAIYQAFILHSKYYLFFFYDEP